MLDRILVPCALILATGLDSLVAQAEWRNIGVVPSERTETPFCYDSARGRSIVYGGVMGGLRRADTWAYAGGQWQRIPVPDGPRLFNPAAAYDSVRDRVVVFGYTMDPGNRLPKTLEFDGTTWVDRMPTTAPFSSIHSGSSQTLAFDESRGVTMMVLGSETWEWDGVDWVQLFPTSQPRAGYGQRLVYHSGRGKMMIVEQRYNPVSTALWEWSGSDWVVVDTNGPGRSAFGLAYDRGRDRLVLFGGTESGSPPFDETWEWDGTSWQRITSIPTVPEARSGCTMTYDRARGLVVMFGGRSAGGGGWPTSARETWEWNGVNWTETTPEVPTPRTSPQLVYELHQGRWIQYGGAFRQGWSQRASDETWAFDGATWTELNTPTRPFASSSHSMVYDVSRLTMVLCDGIDTYELVGDDWVLRAPGPFASQGGMIYDELRARCVVMQPGGFSTPARMWSWDGVVWTELFPPNMPPSDRRRFSLAYDSRRDEIVFFGGSTQSPGPLIGETWIFDGVDWRLAATTGPSPRADAGMVYDPDRDRVVLHGGTYTGGSRTGETWEWDGSSWSLTASGGYTESHETCLAFDPVHRRVVGTDDQFSRLWEFSSPQPALVTAIGLGCFSSAGPTLLQPAAGGLPWVGDTMELVASVVPSSGPLPPSFVLGGQTNLDLTGVGAPGCRLFVDAFFVAPMVRSGGMATWSLPVPQSTALAGLVFYGQTIVPDTGANALGIATSNGVQIEPGIR